RTHATETRHSARRAEARRIALDYRPDHTGTVTGTTWRNWADCAHARPHVIAQPSSAEDVARTVQDAAAQGLPVKAVGSGHSFTPVAATDGVMVDLRRTSGIRSVVPTSTGAHVTAGAGTPLRRLNELLWAL